MLTDKHRVCYGKDVKHLCVAGSLSESFLQCFHHEGYSDFIDFGNVVSVSFIQGAFHSFEKRAFNFL